MKFLLLPLIILFFSDQSFSRDCVEILKSFNIRESEYAYKFDSEQFQIKIKQLTRNKSLKIEQIGKIENESIYAIKILNSNSDKYKKKYKILITAGVHGNEPVGVSASLNFIEHVLADPKIFDDFEITVVPNLNPWGLNNFVRVNQQNIDINRSFLDELQTDNAKFLNDYLRSGSGFDMALDLHGAFGKTGFFVIKSGDDDGIAVNAINAIDDHLKLFPLDEQGNKMNKFPEQIGPYHLSSPGVTETDTSGTLKSFFKEQQIPYAYTIEYPGFEIVDGKKVALDRRKQTRMMTHLVRSMIFSMRKIGRTPQSKRN